MASTGHVTTENQGGAVLSTSAVQWATTKFDGVWKGLTPLVETGEAEAPSFPEHLHWHMVYEQVDQHRGAPYQLHVIALIGVLQAEVEVFDGGATALYPHTHGCVLLWGCVVCAL
jgi:hypothetical protein